MTDDKIGATIKPGTGYLNILVGNLKVGNGVVTQTQDGEDAYIEGMLETDGAAWFDGATYFGKGEGATGCTISAAGALSCDGTALVNALTVTGTTALNGAVTATSTVAQTLVNVAGGSANPWDYTGTLGIMDNSDDFTLFDVNITNANHTGTVNAVQALDIAAIAGDADATEAAIKVEWAGTMPSMSAARSLPARCWCRHARRTLGWRRRT